MLDIDTACCCPDQLPRFYFGAHGSSMAGVQCNVYLYISNGSFCIGVFSSRICDYGYLGLWLSFAICSMYITRIQQLQKLNK